MDLSCDSGFLYKCMVGETPAVDVRTCHIGIVVAALSKIENFEMSATSSYCNGIIGNSVCLMEHITKQ